MQKIKSNFEVTPYCVTLRNALDSKLTTNSISQTEILNRFMEELTKIEMENKFSNSIEKKEYFSKMYRLIHAVLFK